MSNDLFVHHCNPKNKMILEFNAVVYLESAQIDHKTFFLMKLLLSVDFESILESTASHESISAITKNSATTNKIILGINAGLLGHFF